MELSTDHILQGDKLPQYKACAEYELRLGAKVEDVEGIFLAMSMAGPT